MNVVLDTNTILSATLWNNSEAQKLLFHLININAHLYISMPIIIEYQKVMQRDFKFTEQEIIEIASVLIDKNFIVFLGIPLAVLSLYF